MSSSKKKRYLSGAKKRKKQQEKATTWSANYYNIYIFSNLVFTRESALDQPDDFKIISSASANEVIEIDIALTSESAAETILEVQIHQLHHQNRVHQGPEYKKNFGLWPTIINEVQNFWCNRDIVKCKHFDDDFSVSTISMVMVKGNSHLLCSIENTWMVNKSKENDSWILHLQEMYIVSHVFYLVNQVQIDLNSRMDFLIGKMPGSEWKCTRTV